MKIPPAGGSHPYKPPYTPAGGKKIIAAYRGSVRGLRLYLNYRRADIEAFVSGDTPPEAA